jgi:hypothetical protein
MRRLVPIAGVEKETVRPGSKDGRHRLMLNNTTVASESNRIAP